MDNPRTNAAAPYSSSSWVSRAASHVERFKANLGELRMVFFQNVAHGVIHGMNGHWPLAATSSSSRKSRSKPSLPCTSEGLGSLKVDWVIDFATAGRETALNHPHVCEST